MKKTSMALLLFAAFSANAQMDTAQINYTKLSDSTEIGKPDGKSTSQEIGVAGGVITSDDGIVKLIFPAGAVTKNTVITIQPSTNHAPNGVGKSYWFEPSGIQFKKPVQIIFKYTDDEADICPPDFMSLGVQTKSGKWSFVDYESFDTVSMTLTGNIYHFSGVSRINDVQIRPDKNKLRTGDRTPIDVVDISRFDTTMPSGHQLALLPGSNSFIWYVNGVVNGNERTGTVEYQSFPLGRERLTGAGYKAPQLLPKAPNPVKITAEIYRKTRKGKALRKRISAYILVYDMYKVSMIHDFIAREGMNSELKDSASCIVSVYPDEVKISDIKNYPPSVIKEGRNGPFREKIYTDGASGSIHLTESFSNVKLSKDYPAEVYFEPLKIQVLTYKFKYCGRGGACSEIEPIMGLTLPPEINFIANGKDQKYAVNVGGKEKFLLVVTPHRVR